MGLSDPFNGSIGLQSAMGTSLTPFGFATGVVNGVGPGNLQIGPMGISSSLSGPLEITPQNTINKLGAASPFATPIGITGNPLEAGLGGVTSGPLSLVQGLSGPLGLGANNGFPQASAGFGIGMPSNLGGIPMSAGLAGTAGTGSPLVSPLGAGLGGGQPTNVISWLFDRVNQLSQTLGQFASLLGIPMASSGSVGQAGTAFFPQQALAGGMAGPAGSVILPQQALAGGMVGLGGNAIFPQQAFAGGMAGVAGNTILPQQAVAGSLVGFGGNMLLPQQALAGGMVGLAGNTLLPQQALAGGMVPLIGLNGQSGNPLIPPQLAGNVPLLGLNGMTGLGGSATLMQPGMITMNPLQAFSGGGLMNNSMMMGMGGAATQIPPQIAANPIVQQFMQNRNFGGTSGLLVSPLGTYITSIGPQGGTANAGFLGTQSSGSGSAITLNPINPAMIVSISSAAYASTNFNRGFFAA